MRLVGALVCVALGGCTSLPTIAANECGNAVIESGEACDTFVDVPGGVCRPPGVVGECRYDCRPSFDGTRGKCPDKQGCADDGTCREPSGGFQPPVSISLDAASWLSSADFDGDGREDVLSADLADQFDRARFRLHYFDADSNLVETRKFPRLGTRPVAHRLDADDRDDLVFSDFRIGMLKGRRDREWIPSTFSSYVVENGGQGGLRALSLSHDLVGDTLPLAVYTTIRGKSGIFVQSSNTEDERLEVRAELGRPVSDLIAPPLALDVVNGAESPCSEVIVAFRGDSSFFVLDMCQVGGHASSELVWRDQALIQRIALPVVAQIEAPPLAADVDGDGHVDVMLGTNFGIFVAYGDGTKLSDEAVPFALPVEQDGQVQEVPLRMPLAAGDITGDGVADFVLPHVVLGSRKSLVDGRLVYGVAFENSAQDWTTAEVVDLNGNGLSDVIAGTIGAPGLSFLNGRGGRFAVPSRLPTRGPLRLLTSGDFDGDGVRDVAFSEGGAAGDDDALEVAYGRRDRAPEDPIRIAELRGVEQLGRLSDGALDDVFTASNDGARSTFTIFGGDADRLPFAPYTLVDFYGKGSLKDSAALALIVGKFTAAGTNDVLALGSDLVESRSQWLLPDIASGLTPPRPLPSKIPSASLLRGPDSSQLSVAGVAADVDADGRDEALWLTDASPDGCSLLVYGVAEDGKSAELRQNLSLGEACPRPALAAMELDVQREHVHQPTGVDLLLSTGDPHRRSRGLRTLWNDGNGHFTLQQSTLLSDVEGRDIRAFSVLPGTRSIAFVTDSTLELVSFASDTRELGDQRTLAHLDDARAVVAMDPNGDQLTDLVVSDAEGIWLLRVGFK